MTENPIHSPFGAWKSRLQTGTFAELHAVTEPVYGPAGHQAWI